MIGKTKKNQTIFFLFLNFVSFPTTTMLMLPKDITLSIIEMLCVLDIHALHQTCRNQRQLTHSKLVELREWITPSPDLNRLTAVDRLHVRRLLFFSNENSNQFSYQSLDQFPFVTHMTFDDPFDQTLSKGSIPEGITHLIFGGFFNRPLVKGVFPPGITHLTFGDRFNQPIMPGVIPHGVKNLKLAFLFYFKQPWADIPHIAR